MITYKSAGVDINAGEELVSRLKKKLPSIGGFGGFFPVPLKEYTEPMLVASTDGVGTKLLVAEKLNNHKTIGIDLVAMVVNDISVCGADPLFFLDYYATGKLSLDQAEEILSSIMDGCKQAGCILLGGETAEMPGMYEAGKYDLAGFGVGIVDKNKIIDGSKIKADDVFIGIASSGLHSNGYSLARKVIFEKAGVSPDIMLPGSEDTVGEAMIRPTIIYSALVSELMKEISIKGMAHITGGGIPGNLVRILPPGIDAEIDTNTWEIPPIFNLIRESGPVAPEEMFSTFNMGIGLIMAANPGDVANIQSKCKKHNLDSYIIGKAKSGEGKVIMTGKDFD
jgi:phosphoribosylformylglycinamidine cyclo-ligase